MGQILYGSEGEEGLAELVPETTVAKEQTGLWEDFTGFVGDSFKSVFEAGSDYLTKTIQLQTSKDMLAYEAKLESDKMQMLADIEILKGKLELGVITAEEKAELARKERIEAEAGKLTSTLITGGLILGGGLLVWQMFFRKKRRR